MILACNTAAAVALRRLQQTWLPGYRREIGRPVNVLGLIVPTIEAATGLPWEHEAERRGDKVEKLDVLGVFSTPATANSRVYEIEIDKRRQDIAVFSEPCPELARHDRGRARRAGAGAPSIAGACAGADAPHRPLARPGDPGLHPLRDHRRPVPRRPAGRARR